MRVVSVNISHSLADNRSSIHFNKRIPIPIAWKIHECLPDTLGCRGNINLGTGREHLEFRFVVQSNSLDIVIGEMEPNLLKETPLLTIAAPHAEINHEKSA